MAQVLTTFHERGHTMIQYTIVVTEIIDLPAAIQYLSPYTGTVLVGYFMYCECHTLIINDDVFRHAQTYPQIPSIKNSPMVAKLTKAHFYLHSRLLEKFAKLNLF